MPTSEDREPAPLSPYGASKWAAESYVKTWGLAGGVAERGGATRERVRPAAVPARGGGGGGDLRAQAVHRRAPATVRASAGRPGITCTWRRGQRTARGGGQGRHVQRRDRRGDGRDDGVDRAARRGRAPTWSRSWRNCAAGELQHSRLDCEPRGARARLAPEVSITEGLRTTYEALVQEFERAEVGASPRAPRPRPRRPRRSACAESERSQHGSC